jgi:hypothetical protein
MNKRERVLQAVNHREIDFVPCNFHAVPAVWERLCQHYSLADHHEAMAYIGGYVLPGKHVLSARGASQGLLQLPYPDRLS